MACVKKIAISTLQEMVCKTMLKILSESSVFSDNQVLSIANHGIEKVNSMLEPFGISVVYDTDFIVSHVDSGNDALACYENDSIISNNQILIHLNVSGLLKAVSGTTEFDTLREAVLTTIFHEVGHGLCNMIDDWYDYLENHELEKTIDNILGDEPEENVVEEFAWDVLDGYHETNRLWTAWVESNKIVSKK